jgi:hypothetical protein
LMTIETEREALTAMGKKRKEKDEDRKEET